MSIIFYIGLMLLAGLLLGRIAKRVGFPNVTGYILAGLIMGPYVVGIFSAEMVQDMNTIVSEIALGFIALFIGAEFKLSFLKEMGLAPIIIAVFESLLASVFVVIGLVVFQFDFALALILGAIAAATAPAVTIMIIKQYRANGPLTKMLLGVVALDDAVALILFSFAVTIVTAMTAGNINIASSIITPFIQLGASVLIGAVFALILLIPLHFFKKKSNRMCAIVGVVFLASSISNYFGISSLLTCMVLGAVLVNISKEADSVIDISEMLTPPILMLFFVLSGASLDISLIPKIGLIGAIYVITRVVGKVIGSYLGCRVMKTPPTVRKYLGWTLVPQAGVALGLMLVAGRILPEYSQQITAVVLCATLIYELVGSIISKTALAKAGEIPSLLDKIKT